ncbi:MAG: hypothetical protein KBS81_01695 [Spirochaetales bacterium]|nr:hypothetical protein [Candidatus Physcosoma equi]
MGTNPSKTQFYPAVLIRDATACCAQGLEFVLVGGPKYPEGYPEEQAQSTVRGTYETYDERGVLLCHLEDAVLE